MRLLTLQIVLFLTDSNNSFLFIQCSYFHICLYHFFLRFVFFTFLVLFSSARDTFYNLATLFDSNSLQPAFDVTAIFDTESFHCKLETTFKIKKEMKRKNCNLLKDMFCLHQVSTRSLSSLNFLPLSKVFTVMDNPGIFDYFLNAFQFP